MRSLLLAPLLFLGLCPSPTESLEQYMLETRFGPLEVVGRLTDAPALAEGAELAHERASRELPGRAHEFPGILTGWRVVLGGIGSSIDPGARTLRICDSSPACTTHGFFHELGAALAIELRSCPHLHDVWAFSPCRTLACEPC